MKREDTTVQPEQEKLARAMDTIVEVLVKGDLDSVRASVNALDSSVSTRVESLRNETTDAIDRTKKELNSGVSTRLESLKKETTEAFNRSAKELDSGVKRLERLVGDSRSKFDAEVKSVREELQKSLDSKERFLKSELDGLAQGLTALQLALQQQMEQTTRIGSLLDGIGTVFTDRRAAPPVGVDPAVAGPQSLENALDKALEMGTSDSDAKEQSEKVPAREAGK